MKNFIVVDRANRSKYFSRSMLAVMSLVVWVSPVLAGGSDDPLLSMVLIDQLEVRGADSENPTALTGQAWLGYDLQKLWFKAELERLDGETHRAELQALYSRALAPFWDLQVGLRRDFQPTPSRNWAIIGVQGLAPYRFEIDAAVFIGQHGRTALRLEAEYELLFTQRLILIPELEVDLYGKDDAELGIGSGLSSLEAGLRLRYQIRRELAPYVGVNWEKSFGNTADFARSAGETTDEVQWVVGVRAWF